MVCSKFIISFHTLILHLSLNINQWMLALLLALFVEHFKSFAHFKHYTYYHLQFMGHVSYDMGHKS